MLDHFGILAPYYERVIPVPDVTRLVQLLNLPTGCAFHPRCPYAFDRCRVEVPQVQEPRTGCRVACHLYPEHSSLPPVPVG